MYDLIIRNGSIVNADGILSADLAIRGERIAAIGDMTGQEAEHQLDASGKLLLPGGVDAHTHFDLQAGSFRCVDDFSAGTRAALAGGVTTIIDHPAFGPRDCDLHYQIDAYHRLADAHCYTDFSFHGVVQSLYEDLARDMTELVEEGIASVKAYMTYDYKLDGEQLTQLFRLAAASGQLIAVHAEDDAIIMGLRQSFGAAALTNPYYHSLSRPNESEARAIKTLLEAAREAGNVPVYIVHLSTKEGLAAINDARASGQRNILVETCPQYLLLDSRRYLEHGQGLAYMMCPPLRSQADAAVLWQGLSNGAIQTVCTDHCAFSLEQKQAGAADYREAPCGGPGVETRLDLLHSEGVLRDRIALPRLAALTATNPARIFGLYPQKGLLAKGSDADIVIYDPQRSHMLSAADSHGACDYSLYEGLWVTGGVDTVLLRGRVAYENGLVLAHEGDGRFLPRHTELSLLETVI